MTVSPVVVSYYLDCFTAQVFQIVSSFIPQCLCYILYTPVFQLLVATLSDPYVFFCPRFRSTQPVLQSDILLFCISFLDLDFLLTVYGFCGFSVFWSFGFMISAWLWTLILYLAYWTDYLCFCSLPVYWITLSDRC